MVRQLGHLQVSPLSVALHRCRRGLLAVVVFSLAVNLLMLTAPLYMLQVFDRVLTGRSEDTLIYLTLVAGFAFLIFWGLDIVRGRVMGAVGAWLEREVSAEVFAACVRLALGRRHASTQPLRDLATVRSFLSGPAILAIFDAPWTPVYLAVVFMLHPLLGWFGLVGAIGLFGLALANDLATRSALHRAGQLQVDAFGQAEMAARNSDAIQAMGMMPNIVHRWLRLIDGSLGEQRRAGRLNGLISSSAKSIRQLLQVGILGIGAWLVLQNELTAGGMIAGSILMSRALSPVDQAIASWRSAIAARSAFKRVKILLASAELTCDVPPLPRPEGKVIVDNVHFTHPEVREPILRKVGFELEPGQSLGLIGPMAAGKSTLARILVGNLKPQLGHARLDGADVADWDARDRGQHIGYLPQDVELFDGTVRENIARMGEGDADAVYVAAKITGIHEDILALPHGYDTEIGTAGMALSGGQRQRIAFARAVYGEPRLVVLDEPNSNLDIVGEKALVEALEQLKKRRTTVVIITHRSSVLKNVDKLLMVSGGVQPVVPRLKDVSTKASPAQSQSSSGVAIVRSDGVQNA